jgi:hypothetical protein
MTPRRSDPWFHDPDMYGFARRAFAKSMQADRGADFDFLVGGDD